MTSATTSAIATTGLTKVYNRQAVVDQLSLQVGQGEIYGFLGLNGSGKTTTIRMLLGMVRPTAGVATIFGVPAQANERAIWARVGYLVEAPAAYPELTVRENLEVVRRLRRLADPRAVDRVIERLGLAPYAERQARRLSLGNLQRLGLAKALIHAPQLLLLDEPANGLDPAGVVEIRDLLHELVRERGVTVFMSSHILSEVARLATRIGVMSHGRLLEELSAAELEQRRCRWLVVDGADRVATRAALTTAGYAAEAREDGALLLTDPRAIAHPDAIARLLVGADLALTRLSVEQEDLETHFLRLVGDDVAHDAR